jgi:uncharacterized membrane protein
MLKKNKWLLIITTVLMLLPMAFGLCIWDRLPEEIAIHWGVNGKPDDFADRGFAVFALPLILVAVHWLCAIITSFDRKNREKNQKAQQLVLWICPILSLFLNGITYLAAFKKDINATVFVLFFMGALFVVMGNYMPKVTQNRTIGIKIKWTLENEENWNATHRFAGKLFVGGGVLVMIAAFLPTSYSSIVSGIILAAVVISTAVYSYIYSKKHKSEP